MSIIESIAVALHCDNIHLFYGNMYRIVGPSTVFILPVLLYLRYKKIINFITLKCLGMMTIVALVIVGSLYVGWSWIGLFFIFVVYIGIIAFEAEIQKEEETRQNNCQVLDGEHKKEKRQLSRTAKAAWIIFIIASLISAIINYLRLINLK